MVYNLIKDVIPSMHHLKIREDGDFLIVSNHQLNIFFLDEVAKEFYLRANKDRTIEDIVDDLFEIYEVEKEILIDDIINLIRDLQWKRLLSLK